MKALLADVIVTVHLAFVLWVILGLVLVLVGWPLGWRWIRNPTLRVVHLLCPLVVAMEALCGVECPLTTWERDLRISAGQTVEDISFVGRLVRDVLFYEPPDPIVFTISYSVFAALVVAAMFVVKPDWSRLRRRAREA